MVEHHTLATENDPTKRLSGEHIVQRRWLSAAALRALRIRFAVDRFPVDKAIQGGKNDNVGTRQDEVLSFDERTGSRTC